MLDVSATAVAFFSKILKLQIVFVYSVRVTHGMPSSRISLCRHADDLSTISTLVKSIW